MKSFLVSHRGGSTINMDARCDAFTLADSRAPLAGRTPTLDPGGFSLLNWNVQKGGNSGWEEDFRLLSGTSDLLVMQEAYLTEELGSMLQNEHPQWDLTAAFSFRDITAGVLTASRIAPVSLCMFRTEEPLTNIPKTVLISRYLIEGSNRSLLVANVHLINFTLGTSALSAQLRELERILALHRGPLIVAGDFNTWSDSRMALVEAMAGKLDLKEMSFEEDNRVAFLGHNVDHIYYRGLEPGEAAVYKVTTSDHNPMMVTFRLADE